MLLGWQISELAKDFSKIAEKAIDTGNRIQEFIFSNFGISIKEQSQILKKEQPSISGIMQKVLGSVSYALTNFILVLVYIFLLLYYRNHIRRFIVKITPPSQQKEMEQVLNSITHVSQQYLLGLAKMIVCLWIMYGIGFSIIGVKNALFFAIICGLLEIIPFIGNITGTTLTLLVTAAQGASFLMLGFILGTYMLIQTIQGGVLSPLIVGPQVKINPFTTIVVLIIGNLIWGIPGIFIAIPLVAMFKIVCDHIEPLKPYGFLIGDTETKKRESDFIKKIKTRFVKKEKSKP
jgi:predicted PurR-regulated permease PerM